MKYDWYITYNKDTLEVNTASLKQFDMDDMKELLKAARDNDASAQFLIGNQYDARHDYEEAAYHYSLAAQQSYAPAEHYLALCYYHGDGVERDEDMCKYWMSQAINDGDAFGALFMGQRYDTTMRDKPFCNQNDRLSTFWYLIGAKMGNKMCMNNLGYNYRHGIGIEKSETFATYWYNKAVEGGLFINWLNNNPEYKWSSKRIKEFEKKAFYHRIIKFGEYYINNKDEKEPIEWIVCEENDDNMVLISKNSLEVMTYSDSDYEHGWQNSKIREFLNGEFISGAFNEKEKLRLLPQVSKNELNPIYETASGVDTEDMVSLPNMFDLALRLNMDEWGCKNVPASNHLRILGEEYDQWWLRNGGEEGESHSWRDYKWNEYFYATVNGAGKINYTGLDGTICACGVRPLIVVKKTEDKASIKFADSSENVNVLNSNVPHEQQFEWQRHGLCRYCGGKLKGLFRKKCCICGRKKDY